MTSDNFSEELVYLIGNKIEGRQFVEDLQYLEGEDVIPFPAIITPESTAIVTGDLLKNFTSLDEGGKIEKITSEQMQKELEIFQGYKPENDPHEGKKKVTLHFLDNIKEDGSYLTVKGFLALRRILGLKHTTMMNYVLEYGPNRMSDLWNDLVGFVGPYSTEDSKNMFEFRNEQPILMLKRTKEWEESYFIVVEKQSVKYVAVDVTIDFERADEFSFGAMDGEIKRIRSILGWNETKKVYSEGDSELGKIKPSRISGSDAEKYYFFSSTLIKECIYDTKNDSYTYRKVKLVRPEVLRKVSMWNGYKPRDSLFKKLPGVKCLVYFSENDIPERFKSPFRVMAIGSVIPKNRNRETVVEKIDIFSTRFEEPVETMYIVHVAVEELVFGKDFHGDDPSKEEKFLYFPKPCENPLKTPYRKISDSGNIKGGEMFALRANYFPSFEKSFDLKFSKSHNTKAQNDLFYEDVDFWKDLLPLPTIEGGLHYVNLVTFVTTMRGVDRFTPCGLVYDRFLNVSCVIVHSRESSRTDTEKDIDSVLKIHNSSQKSFGGKNYQIIGSGTKYLASNRIRGVMGGNWALIENSVGVSWFVIPVLYLNNNPESLKSMVYKIVPPKKLSEFSLTVIMLDVTKFVYEFEHYNNNSTPDSVFKFYKHKNSWDKKTKTLTIGKEKENWRIDPEIHTPAGLIYETMLFSKTHYLHELEASEVQLGSPEGDLSEMVVGKITTKPGNVEKYMLAVPLSEMSLVGSFPSDKEIEIFKNARNIVHDLAVRKNITILLLENFLPTKVITEELGVIPEDKQGDIKLIGIGKTRPLLKEIPGMEDLFKKGEGTFRKKLIILKGKHAYRWVEDDDRLDFAKTTSDGIPFLRFKHGKDGWIFLRVGVVDIDDKGSLSVKNINGTGGKYIGTQPSISDIDIKEHIPVFFSGQGDKYKPTTSDVIGLHVMEPNPSLQDVIVVVDEHVFGYFVPYGSGAPEKIDSVTKLPKGSCYVKVKKSTTVKKPTPDGYSSYLDKNGRWHKKNKGKYPLFTKIDRKVLHELSLRYTTDKDVLKSRKEKEKRELTYGTPLVVSTLKDKTDVEVVNDPTETVKYSLGDGKNIYYKIFPQEEALLWKVGKLNSSGSFLNNAPTHYSANKLVDIAHYGNSTNIMHLGVQFAKMSLVNNNDLKTPFTKSYPIQAKNVLIVDYIDYDPLGTLSLETRMGKFKVQGVRTGNNIPEDIDLVFEEIKQKLDLTDSNVKLLWYYKLDNDYIKPFIEVSSGSNLNGMKFIKNVSKLSDTLNTKGGKIAREYIDGFQAAPNESERGWIKFDVKGTPRMIRLPKDSKDKESFQEKTNMITWKYDGRVNWFGTLYFDYKNGEVYVLSKKDHYFPIKDRIFGIGEGVFLYRKNNEKLKLLTYLFRSVQFETADDTQKNSVVLFATTKDEYGHFFEYGTHPRKSGTFRKITNVMQAYSKDTATTEEMDRILFIFGRIPSEIGNRYKEFALIQNHLNFMHNKANNIGEKVERYNSQSHLNIKKSTYMWNFGFDKYSRRAFVYIDGTDETYMDEIYKKGSLIDNQKNPISDIYAKKGELLIGGKGDPLRYKTYNPKDSLVIEDKDKFKFGMGGKGSFEFFEKDFNNKTVNEYFNGKVIIDGREHLKDVKISPTKNYMKWNGFPFGDQYRIHRMKIQETTESSKITRIGTLDQAHGIYLVKTPSEYGEYSVSVETDSFYWMSPDDETKLSLVLTPSRNPPPNTLTGGLSLHLSTILKTLKGSRGPWNVTEYDLLRPYSFTKGAKILTNFYCGYQALVKGNESNQIYERNSLDFAEYSHDFAKRDGEIGVVSSLIMQKNGEKLIWLPKTFNKAFYKKVSYYKKKIVYYGTVRINTGNNKNRYQNLKKIINNIPFYKVHGAGLGFYKPCVVMFDKGRYIGELQISFQNVQHALYGIQTFCEALNEKPQKKDPERILGNYFLRDLPYPASALEPLQNIGKGYKLNLFVVHMNSDKTFQINVDSDAKSLNDIFKDDNLDLKNLSIAYDKKVEDTVNNAYDEPFTRLEDFTLCVFEEHEAPSRGKKIVEPKEYFFAPMNGLRSRLLGFGKEFFFVSNENIPFLKYLHKNCKCVFTESYILTKGGIYIKPKIERQVSYYNAKQESNIEILLNVSSLSIWALTKGNLFVLYDAETSKTVTHEILGVKENEKTKEWDNFWDKFHDDLVASVKRTFGVEGFQKPFLTHEKGLKNIFDDPMTVDVILSDLLYSVNPNGNVLASAYDLPFKLYYGHIPQNIHRMSSPKFRTLGFHNGTEIWVTHNDEESNNPEDGNRVIINDYGGQKGNVVVYRPSLLPKDGRTQSAYYINHEKAMKALNAYLVTVHEKEDNYELILDEDKPKQTPTFGFSEKPIEIFKVTKMIKGSLLKMNDSLFSPTARVFDTKTYHVHKKEKDYYYMKFIDGEELFVDEYDVGKIEDDYNGSAAVVQFYKDIIPMTVGNKDIEKAGTTCSLKKSQFFGPPTHSSIYAVITDAETAIKINSALGATKTNYRPWLPKILLMGKDLYILELYLNTDKNNVIVADLVAKWYERFSLTKIEENFSKRGIKNVVYIKNVHEIMTYVINILKEYFYDEIKLQKKNIGSNDLGYTSTKNQFVVDWESFYANVYRDGLVEIVFDAKSFMYGKNGKKQVNATGNVNESFGSTKTKNKAQEDQDVSMADTFKSFGLFESAEAMMMKEHNYYSAISPHLLFSCFIQQLHRTKSATNYYNGTTNITGGNIPISRKYCKSFFGVIESTSGNILTKTMNMVLDEADIFQVVTREEVCVIRDSDSGKVANSPITEEIWRIDRNSESKLISPGRLVRITSDRKKEIIRANGSKIRKIRFQDDGDSDDDDSDDDDSEDDIQEEKADVTLCEQIGMFLKNVSKRNPKGIVPVSAIEGGRGVIKIIKLNDELKSTDQKILALSPGIYPIGLKLEDEDYYTFMDIRGEDRRWVQVSTKRNYTVDKKNKYIITGSEGPFKVKLVKPLFDTSEWDFGLFDKMTRRQKNYEESLYKRISGNLKDMKLMEKIVLGYYGGDSVDQEGIFETDILIGNEEDVRQMFESVKNKYKWTEAQMLRAHSELMVKHVNEKILKSSSYEQALINGIISFFPIHYDYLLANQEFGGKDTNLSKFYHTLKDLIVAIKKSRNNIFSFEPEHFTLIGPAEREDILTKEYGEELTVPKYAITSQTYSIKYKYAGFETEGYIFTANNPKGTTGDKVKYQNSRAMTNLTGEKNDVFFLMSRETKQI